MRQFLFLAVGLSVLLGVSCDKGELDVQDNFPFDVTVMPVPKGVALGETIEIRLAIEREGDYRKTVYYIRYFQFDGEGLLRYYDHAPYLPNDIYKLPSEQFRLYYTSQSTETQAFDVWISDDSGNEKQLNFQFNSTE